MSEKTPVTAMPKSAEHTRRYGRAALSVLVASMLAGSVGLVIKEREELTAQAMQAIGELNPRQQQLDAGRYDTMQSQIRDATVAIWHQPAGEDLAYRVCSGTKISSKAKSYVLTAAHCFGQQPDLNNQSQPVETKKAFQPTSKERGSHYMIGDPTPNRNDQEQTTLLAEVTDSAITNQDDWALLAVTPYKEKARTRAYESIDALPLAAYTSSDGLTIEPGEQIATAGQPSDAAELMETKAYYIDRTTTRTAGGRTQQYDIVGMNVPGAEENPCRPGFSGSQGIAGSGVILGPLSRGVEVPMSTSAAVSYAHQYDLPLAAASYNVMCQYSVASQAAIQQLELQLGS